MDIRQTMMEGGEVAGLAGIALERYSNDDVQEVCRALSNAVSA